MSEKDAKTADDPIRERVAQALMRECYGNAEFPSEAQKASWFKQADAALRECGYEEMRRERDELKAALAWVNTCVPRPLKWGGGSVEMTNEEFNRMRVAIGLAPLPKRARAALSRTQTEG